MKIFEHQQLQNYSNPLIIKTKGKKSEQAQIYYAAQFLDIATQINNRECIKYTQYSLKKTTHTSKFKCQNLQKKIET